MFFDTTTQPQSLHPISRALRYAEAAKPADYIRLCLSIGLWVVSFFMLYQSIALQKMLTKGQEDAPDPEAGAGVSWLLFWLIFGFFCFYWIANAQGQAGYIDPLDFFRGDWWGTALGSPRAFAPAFLIASIAPTIIAIYKFGFAVVLVWSRRARARHITRLAVGAVAGEDASSTALGRIEENVNALKSKFSALENELSPGGKGIRVINEQAEKKRSSDLSYVLAFAFIFVAVTAALVCASFYIPVLSVLSLVPISLLVVMLIAAIDLSKGDKLSERSLMEVFRRAFKFISRRGK